MDGHSASGKRRRYSLNTPKMNRARIRNILLTLRLLLDAALLLIAFVGGYYARQLLPFFPRPELQPALRAYIPMAILHILTVIVVFFVARLYHQRRSLSRFDLFRTILASVTIGSLLASSIQDLFLRQTPLEVDYPRSMFIYVSAFSVILVGLGREFHRILEVQLRRHKIYQDNLLIVGKGRVLQDITAKILNSPDLGYNLIGIVNDGQRPGGKMLGVPYIGNFPRLPEIIDSQEIEQVIIAISDANRSELVELITLCQRGRVDIKVYPDIFAYMAGDLNVDDLAGTPLLTVRDIALRGWRLSLKRSLDVVGAVIGLTFLSPFMMLTALIIKRTSEGPVFYSQERMGLDGKSFPLIKFRSMREDAEVDGPGWTVENDPRVTRIGRFMRRTNWDEIPQLINVLVGHMSLVGPRPERPVYVQQFRESVPRYMERHQEKAGLTGWAQVNGLRGDTSVAERTTYDLWYVENWSLWLDIKIIIRTVTQTIFGRSKNAY